MCTGDDDSDDDAVCLQPPGWGDLGALGVFAGLYLIIKTEPLNKVAVPLLEDCDGSGFDSSPDGRKSLLSPSLSRSSVGAPSWQPSISSYSMGAGYGNLEKDVDTDPPAYTRSTSFTATPLFRGIDSSTIAGTSVGTSSIAESISTRDSSFRAPSSAGASSRQSSLLDGGSLRSTIEESHSSPAQAEEPMMIQVADDTNRVVWPRNEQN